MQILKPTDPFKHWRTDAALKKLASLQFPKVFGKLTGTIPYDTQDVCMRCPHPNPLFILSRGIGKSRVLETQGMAQDSVVLPFLKARLNKLDRPVKFTGLFIAPTKDQSFEMQAGMSDLFDGVEWLANLKSRESTKTNLLLTSERGVFGRVLIRPATAGARGLHAQTKTTAEGEVIKGIIKIKVDEGWYLPEEILNPVLKPMMLIGGKGSALGIYTTPGGKFGDVWDQYDAPTTGHCLQRYVYVDGYRCYDFTDDLIKEVRDGEGLVKVSRRTAGRVSFSPQRCMECMTRFVSVIHNAPSVENPYADHEFLKAEKVRLTSSGQLAVWRREYLGIPETSAGLFFSEEDQRRMFDDDLPQYRITEYGELRKLVMNSGEPAEMTLSPRDYSGEFYIGIDGNMGVETRRADFAVLSLGQLYSDGFAPLRLIERFRVTDGSLRVPGRIPPRFAGERFKPHEVVLFVVALALILAKLFGVRKIYVDQGAGHAYYVPLAKALGESRVEYIKTSVQEKMRSLLHLRSMIQTGKATAPMIEWLKREAQYLEVVEDSLDDNKIKVRKAKSWGSSAAQVDGIFSWAYMMRGTEKAVRKAKLLISSPMGGDPRFGQRDLSFPARDLRSRLGK